MVGNIGEEEKKINTQSELSQLVSPLLVKWKESGPNEAFCGPLNCIKGPHMRINRQMRRIWKIKAFPRSNIAARY